MQVQATHVICPQKSQVVFGTPPWEVHGRLASLLHLHTCQQACLFAMVNVCTAVQEYQQRPMPSECSNEAVTFSCGQVRVWGGVGGHG